jgi:hypothetical protein
MTRMKRLHTGYQPSHRPSPLQLPVPRLGRANVRGGVKAITSSALAGGRTPGFLTSRGCSGCALARRDEPMPRLDAQAAALVARASSGADIVSQNASGTVVNHLTFFPAGDEVWATFTETGKVTLTDSNGVTYTGTSPRGGTSTGTSRTPTTASPSPSCWRARTARPSPFTRCSISRSTRSTFASKGSC